MDESSYGVIMMCPLLLLMYVGFGGVFSSLVWWASQLDPKIWIEIRHIFKSNMTYTLLTHVVIGHFLFIFYVGENFVLVVILE
jgi:hypothetical protein